MIIIILVRIMITLITEHLTCGPALLNHHRFTNMNISFVIAENEQNDGKSYHENFSSVEGYQLKMMKTFQITMMMILVNMKKIERIMMTTQLAV